jgi:exodeoxyribonuclease-5
MTTYTTEDPALPAHTLAARQLSDTPALNDAQAAALGAIVDWASSTPALDDAPFRVLKGYAGSGKTFMLRQLPDRMKGRIVWTAPTNKATKCLREALTADDYKPDCRTIYSLLGLRLEANGEVKELSQPEDPVDLSTYRLVVVDEAFMLNKAVMAAIQSAHNTSGVRFLFVGDPCQLPPVKEDKSPVEALPVIAELTEVMRHDNQILTIATHIRSQIGKAMTQLRIASDNDGAEGVWRLDRRRFEALILDKAGLGWFSDGTTAKAIAWRNVEVDRLNAVIRNKIFPGVTEPYVIGDRVIFTSPASDLDDQPMASTDDEGVVEGVVEEPHPLYGEFTTLRLSITLDTNRLVTARVLHPRDAAAWQRKKDDLALLAKSNGRLWRNFWDFIEAFHSLRHAYAITAHRSQGSTYDNAFVLWSDIMLNRNRTEALRCLYVASTRARKRLVLGD